MKTSSRPESTRGLVGSLPQRKAFVVQFSAEAGPRTGLFLGRVEHVMSGDQAAFQSTDELWAFVRGVLTRPSPSQELQALPPARAAG